MTRALALLITAGPTREYIDSVRYLSNDSSGKMGFALAAAARARGHRVTLIHGPVALPPPAGVTCRAVLSAAQMLRACRAAWPKHDVLIMAAAVADYTVAKRSAVKLKKTRRDLTLRLVPTVDILATLAGARRARQRVIGFALEDRAPRRHARAKLEKKGLDAIVLNSPRAISADRSRLQWLVRGAGWTVLPESAKQSSAQQIVRLAERLASAAPDMMQA